MPLAAAATGAAKRMAQALLDSSLADNGKVSFSSRGKYPVSSDYMKALGGRFANRDFWAAWSRRQLEQRGSKAPLWVRPDGGSWQWRNSEDFHRIARIDDRSFWRTGGMWKGLRVRNWGGNGAIIEFAGQSVGQTGSMVKRRGRRKEGEDVVYERKSKVNNALKAWTVFAQTGILVVKPDPQTQQAFEDAAAALAERWGAKVLGGTDIAPSVRGALAQEFLKAMEG